MDFGRWLVRIEAARPLSGVERTLALTALRSRLVTQNRHPSLKLPDVSNPSIRPAYAPAQETAQGLLDRPWTRGAVEIEYHDVHIGIVD